tara:strand:+ start:2680 stop:3180 length:501 start_codon:yes stop_codon:yes gene_type:complete
MDQPEKCPSQHEFYEQFRSVFPYPLDVHLGTNFLQILAILGHSPVLPVLQSYFGTDDLVVPFGSMLARYVEPRSGEGTVYWHQDGTTIESTSLVTCWIPFSPYGFMAPGLKIALPNLLRLIDATEFPEHALSAEKWDIWKPICGIGDVIVFDAYVPHSTQYHERMH